MKDKLTHIENKIHQLRQKKERIQTQQAIFFLKEAQKILKEEFSPDIALNVLKNHWNGSSEAQKEEWKKCEGYFLIASQETRKKTEERNSASKQSGKAEASHHEYP